MKILKKGFQQQHNLMRPKSLAMPWKGRQGGLTQVAHLNNIQHRDYDDDSNLLFADSGSEELEHLLV